MYLCISNKFFFTGNMVLDREGLNPVVNFPSEFEAM
jgi:hypothetical protein